VPSNWKKEKKKSRRKFIRKRGATGSKEDELTLKQHNGMGGEVLKGRRTTGDLI